MSRPVKKRTVTSKRIMHGVLTIVIATSMAGKSFGQYQGYSSSPQNETYAPQGSQLPPWNSVLSPASRLPPTHIATGLPAPATQAYSPSQTPSVNPFANIHSRQPQMGMSYGSIPVQPATRTYNTYPTSFGDQQQNAVGDGLLYSRPTQQTTPNPSQNSLYDQPAQSYGPQSGYGFDPTGTTCSTGGTIQVRSGWYGGAIGMIMSRSHANNLWLSFDQADVRSRVLNSNDADFTTAGGAGANIGHYFNCGRNSVQLVYWGIYPGMSEANAYWTDTAGGLNSILHFGGLQFDAGAGPEDLGGIFFFDAERHRVQRSYSANNIELNLLGHNFVSGCGPVRLGWTAGVRYLRFDEDFLYSSDPSDTDFTGAPEEVHYAIDVKNNLIGFQIGGQADYCVGSRLSLFANTKVGIYGNHMSQHSRIYGEYGVAFVGDGASPYYGQEVDITAKKDAFSMIGDLSVGANWCISPCWTITAGYRALGVNGVALSTNQVPVDYLDALDSIRKVNSNGCLILHGAFAGINYCY